MIVTVIGKLELIWNIGDNALLEIKHRKFGDSLLQPTSLPSHAEVPGNLCTHNHRLNRFDGYGENL